ncbi:acyl-CoA dehydrogenase-like protein [Paraburkholderia sp. BL8N3]|nr:acyl-CoA dehydrogenase C-terminal domain-containing protein [Paraburkholderia sp. BL8N3]TCK33753.1 acyl-CoA dehydrogenase-like protein [Paraburkholderia sp. BL8N3]
MSYTAPPKDMWFVIKELAGISEFAALPSFEDAALESAQTVLDEAAKFNGEVLAPQNDRAAFNSMHGREQAGRAAMWNVVDFVLDHAKSDPNAVFAGSVASLRLAGIVLSGWQMARTMIAATRKHAADPSLYVAKIATAHFSADHILLQAEAMEASIVSVKGNKSLFALAGGQF